MKKIMLIAILSLSALLASNGEDIYKTKCSMCHKSEGMMSQSERKSMKAKMKNATKEERMAMKESMMAKMKNSIMLAPSMPMVSKRLKSQLKTRDEFIAFVEDYIQNPSQEKGFCMPMAYKKFGTMPPIGKGMTAEERATIAAWLYDNYKGKWGDSTDSKMCEMKNKNMNKKGMKCGSGKYGGAKKSSKNSQKCGAVAIPTH